MGMGIGTNAQNPDQGELTRKLEEIACGLGLPAKERQSPKWSNTRMKKA